MIAAYKGFFTVLFGVSPINGAIANDALRPYATGPALEALAGTAEAWSASGKELGGQVTFASIEVVVNADEATATECRDTSTELVVDAATKAAVSSGSPGTRIDANMARESGSWKVYEYGWTVGGC